MAVLEDPDGGSEHGGQRQHVEHQRLDRQHHASGEQEEQHKCGERDQPDGQRQPVRDRLLAVDEYGRPAADEHRRPRGHGGCPDGPGNVLPCAGGGVDRGDHLKVGAGADGEPSVGGASWRCLPARGKGADRAVHAGHVRQGGKLTCVGGQRGPGGAG